ncbi:DUF11 domain-containing protein [Diaphorobacter sp. HDW4B]|uniref:putative Ig domain-containing protein n=1 Tax=Diaphorobacter sp. HDW4B TaxID=2714925 RepID=UPI00140B7465|nr:putative Ig domain-containing protein [Diaphorobacter sp. HDW4B]QIL71021.1 DUF11 domain-containing protein [Diaphorobacter sp. HDW4B]
MLRFAAHWTSTAARWRDHFAGAILGLWVLSLITWGSMYPSHAFAQASPLLEFTEPLSSHEPELKRPAILDRLSSKSALAASPVIRKALGSAGMQSEVEPNGTAVSATPIVGTSARIRGNLYPNGDIDYYSFTAQAGDRVYAATMTSGSAGSSTDSQLTLLASDGTTVIEFDDDNGTFAALSSSIAGATISAAGTYFFKVNDFTPGTTSMRGYELYFRLQSGTPAPESESNDTPGTANVLPANGWVSGTRGVAAATEQDWFSMNLNAGDTVFLSLDLDPERDGVTWNGRLGFALFGDASNQILVADDAGTGDVTPNPNIPSEAMFMTVKDAGTYYAFVDSASPATGGSTATYHLSVTVFPAVDEGVNCTTYTSIDVPKTIGPGTGLTSSTIVVPGNPRVADVNVHVQLNHALMQDIDAVLRSPAGTSVQLFSDIGAAGTGGQNQMDTVFDDEAAVPPTFTVLKGLQLKPEINSSAGSRLSWFDGQNAGGTWTLDLYDDTDNVNSGTLTGWSVRICEAPPPPSCPAGHVPVTVFSTDFESGTSGFTHLGIQDEWALGLPASVATTTANPVAAFMTCNSGSNCFKTDLDNTYDANSNQDLFSPLIDLSGYVGPVVVNWAHQHQVETANFDHYYVDAEDLGNSSNNIRLYEWLDPTPISSSAGTGNPQVNIGTAIGWGEHSARVDNLAGKNMRLRFHLDSGPTIQFGGVAVDDISVTACRPSQSDVAITNTNATTTSTPGDSTTYTVTASNAGPSDATGATVSDTFPPACTGVSWTCAGSGNATCTASGNGNISDAVSLPAGGSVTYTAHCSISSAATGSLVNTATISATNDSTPSNNSANDSDTLTPRADLSITKTDGVTTATAGGSVTYTITASNAGPSNAIGATVADTFPASLTATWTCVGAGGGTCTASGSGNINDTVNIPAGGSVTYTASATLSAAATGSLSNTAAVAAPAGVTDPNPGNNSATDTDTIFAAPRTVGGMVSGLATGKSVVLQNNGGDNLTVSANGAFTFTTQITNGNAYAVTVLTQPADQTCTVSQGSGTMGISNVTNVVVSCVSGTHTVGGAVSGLATGKSMVLQNNGGDNLTVSANGAFTFTTQITNGNAYAVTVLTQPADQTCIVSQGSGTMGASDVSNVTVSCVAGLAITTAGFGNLQAGQALSGVQLGASGGSGSYMWSATDTAQPLPAGLSLSASGLLTGTPTTAGNYNTLVTVTDSGGTSKQMLISTKAANAVSQVFSGTVAAATAAPAATPVPSLGALAVVLLNLAAAALGALSLRWRRKSVQA